MDRKEMGGVGAPTGLTPSCSRLRDDLAWGYMFLAPCRLGYAPTPQQIWEGLFWSSLKLFR